MPDVQKSQALSGRGIAGTLDGRQLALGNRRMLDEFGLQPGELLDTAQRWEAEGRTLLAGGERTATARARPVRLR